MEKIDFKKDLKELYAAKSGVFSLVKVPTLTFLMVDGSGDPSTSKEYSAAIESLYTLSYTLKFMSKKDLDRDYAVPPLEGLWWSEDMKDFEEGNRDRWLWTAMIMIPKWITAPVYRKGLTDAVGRKPLVDFAPIRREPFNEGLCVQTLFVGPYRDEGPVIEELHSSFIPTHGLAENGKHHEIYLSDPRRTAPDKLRTIIRQPVTKR